MQAYTVRIQTILGVLDLGPTHPLNAEEFEELKQELLLLASSNTPNIVEVNGATLVMPAKLLHNSVLSLVPFCTDQN